MLDAILKRGKKITQAITRLSKRRHPRVTFYQCGENSFRVVTRNGLGSRFEEEVSTQAEMRAVAVKAFDRLHK